MDLDKIIKTEDIENELIYQRDGKILRSYPKKDCADDGTDEHEQLKKIPGQYYFYGEIKAEIIKALNKTKVDLSSKKASTFLFQQMELQKVEARITDKVLENLVNSEPEVVSLKAMAATLESAESKIETILKALLLKQDALIESGRRKNQELKAINKL
jgi:hypothetical protein